MAIQLGSGGFHEVHMMRILMAAVVGAALSFSTIAPLSAAPTPPGQQEILLKKKKKQAEAARLKKINDAKAKQDALKKLQARKAADKKKTQLASGKKCKFLECLFANKKTRVTRDRSLFQTASFSAAPRMSGRKTRKSVDWSETKYPVGSIIVKTTERALYYIKSDGEAIRYSVGVGKEGMQWSGQNRISRKTEWPSWTPPQTMIEREAAKGNYLPDFMEGGPGNPLGARALYVGSTMFRVHGTNNEASIGGAVSSGCIRMMNADVIDLYDRVKVGARIYVYQ
jgi:lipoprotein-anchoring transpeptidase ErfK/SrfK